MRTFDRTVNVVVHSRELPEVDRHGKLLPPEICMNCEAVGTYDVYVVVGHPGRYGPICYPCVSFMQDYVDRGLLSLKTA